jgi:hypothetical protein
MVNEQLTTSFPLLVTVQLTVVVPIGNVLPLGGEQLTV